MIHRTVLIKLKDDQANDSGRAAVVERTREALRDLPGVRALTVGIPADDRSRRDWDVLIEVRFNALEEVAPYLSHPDHRAYVDEFLAPRLEVIKAWNFAV